MLRIVILAVFVGIAYSQDLCQTEVQRCARAFADSKREVVDWTTARNCMQRVGGDCEVKTNTLKWINGEIMKAESGMVFSECDHSVTQCHLNFMMSKMDMADWMAYMPCLNMIYPGCKGQSDTLYWVNEEVRKAVGQEAPMCNRTVSGCRSTFEMMTDQDMSSWRAYNSCVTAIEPRCTAQSDMIWYINEEVRKATDVPAADSCEAKVDLCVRDLYMTGQKEEDWVSIRDNCMPRIYMECQKKTDTLWWINDQIRKFKETDPVDECYHKDRSQYYQGNKSTSATGRRCLAWNTVGGPTAQYFVDGKVPTNNFCRDIFYAGDSISGPTPHAGEPWCYTGPTAADEEVCGVPVCQATDCNSCDCHVTKCINQFYMTTQEMGNWYDYRSCIEMVMPGCMMKDNTLREVIDAIWDAENTGIVTMSGSQRVAQLPVLMIITAMLAWALV